ncbi:serine/threonine-protein kinase [Actinomadura sp. DC4]|uniref:serine/threonine-protein kinase n=1 Tax=Actinomadura sp. DC4 TaxID=3055069 RepID=UPI0025B0F0E4|nr:serine/threonine-protein kinase [Actinomadura sp. DC4]MDN3358070.1 serine/threonine-protein kinase [Actinomadura sp. DC4]
MTERVVAGRYRLVSPIGRGGMGVVWRAWDETLRREVAVKEILLSGDLPESERSELQRRAVREARAAALLDHPGIIAVHDVIHEDDRPWTVMELLTGRSLGRAAPLPPQAVAAIGLRVLDALGAAHARGVLHRDVKPTNVFLCDDGRVVLADFGIASLEGDPSLTRTGDFVGSPGFVAPERLRERSVGPPSDLWSLGATLYTAVEGRSPFGRDTPMAALGAVLTDEPPPPVRAGPLAPVLWRLLLKDPAARISAPDAARALRQVSQGLPSGLEMPRPVRRRRTGSLALAAAAVVLLAVAAAVAFRVRDGAADHTEERPPAAATTSASPSQAPVAAARYARPFDFCALLSQAQVDALIPGAEKLASGDAHSCDWGTAARHQGLSVTAEYVFDPVTGTAAEDPWTTTPAAAKGAYERQRAADRKASGDVAWGWDEIGVRRTGARRSAARAVSGVGEDAYTTETFHGSTLERADVRFRDSNLYLRVWFVAAGGATDAARIRQDTLKAAHWVAATLRRMP